MKNLKELKETYKKLGEEIKELENSKIDFSKWVGRFNNTLAIKGDKNLVSYRDGDILYTNKNVSCSDDKINYEHTTLDKLKEGDVFICECDLNHIGLEFFYIYKGKGYNNYVFQHLEKYSGIEKIDYKFSDNGNTKVIKFLRH